MLVHIASVVHILDFAQKAGMLAHALVVVLDKCHLLGAIVSDVAIDGLHGLFTDVTVHASFNV